MAQVCMSIIILIRSCDINYIACDINYITYDINYIACVVMYALQAMEACMYVCAYVRLSYCSLNTTFTDHEEDLFTNLADIVQWVDTPVQYQNTLNTESVKNRVKTFEKALEVSKDSFCFNLFIYCTIFEKHMY